MSATAALRAALREEDVVAAIEEIAGQARRRSIVLGIGDDAALWIPSRSNRSAISTDLSIESVHFDRALMSLRDAGWRAMSANASDLAAMGARPVLATVALGFPVAQGVEDVRSLYAGLAESARCCGLDIVGGDVSRAPVLTIAIAVVGEVRPSNAKTRGGGRPGAILAVTGPLGAARAGLHLAGEPGLFTGDDAKAALAAFRRPQARIAEGRFLSASRNVLAMMDVSDGLSTDLTRMTVAAGCGATIENVPFASAARAAATARGEDPERYALAGGEDFELLAAIRPRAFKHLAGRFEARFGRALLPVGRLREGSGIDVRGEAVAATGWDHFRDGCEPG